MIYNPIIIQQNSDAVDLSKLQEIGTRLVYNINLNNTSFTERLPVNSSCDQYIHLTLTQGSSYQLCDDRWYKLSKIGEFTNIYTNLYGEYYNRFTNYGMYLVPTYSNGSLTISVSGAYQGAPMLTAQFYADVSSLKPYSGIATLSYSAATWQWPSVSSGSFTSFPLTLSSEISGKTPEFITISYPENESQRIGVSYVYSGTPFNFRLVDQYPNMLLNTNNNADFLTYAIKTSTWAGKTGLGTSGDASGMLVDVYYNGYTDRSFEFRIYNSEYPETLTNFSLSGQFNLTYYCLN